jgi:hypothetical protein
LTAFFLLGITFMVRSKSRLRYLELSCAVGSGLLLAVVVMRSLVKAPPTVMVLALVLLLISSRL